MSRVFLSVFRSSRATPRIFLLILTFFLASIAGAILAFLIGRYFARGWVAKQIENYPKFKAIDEAVAKEGWKIVGLTRLSPIFPFVVINYAFAITQVSLRDYTIASWIGMLLLSRAIFIALGT